MCHGSYAFSNRINILGLLCGMRHSGLTKSEYHSQFIYTILGSKSNGMYISFRERLIFLACKIEITHLMDLFLGCCCCYYFFGEFKLISVEPHLDNSHDPCFHYR